MISTRSGCGLTRGHCASTDLDAAALYAERMKRVMNVVCLHGNVPASLLTTGTPEQVEAYCRMLIEKVGKKGGFILDGATGIPDESRPQNVRPMYESVRRYNA